MSAVSDPSRSAARRIAGAVAAVLLSGTVAGKIVNETRVLTG